MQNINCKKTGFTLIELLVVISVIALLIAIMVYMANVSLQRFNINPHQAVHFCRRPM